jgi:hypothetical protein
MTQAQPILDRFADAYLVAMLDKQNPKTVLASYQQSHPELSKPLQDQATSLNVLYGFLEEEAFASESEISVVYNQFALPVTPVREAATARGAIARIAALFAKPSFTYRFATVMTVVLATLLLWKPWSATSPTTPTVAPVISDTEPTSIGSGRSSNPVATSPSVPTPAPVFRGTEGTQSGSSSSAIDHDRLNSLVVSGDLSAPKMIAVTADPGGIVIAEWQPVKGALNYFVEIKGQNEPEYHAVAQSNKTKAQITALTAGETINVRVYAASGQKKGPPSTAVEITIQ